MSDEPPEKTGSRSPRTPEASTLSLRASARDIPDQLKEDLNEGEESDSPIVVRDGKADRMTKGWAERQSEQSTHAGKGLFPSSVSRSLFALGAKLDTLRSALSLCARLSEEPGAGKPHDGICEGDAG